MVEKSKAVVNGCGAKSYVDSVAILSHVLQNGGWNGTVGAESPDMVNLIRDYFAWKKIGEGVSDEEIRKAVEAPHQAEWFNDFYKAPFQAPNNPKFTFIDLFAGIGGFRLAMQSLGGKCLFSSEWDNDARLTYMSNFGDMPFGDITLKTTKSYIPKEFDVLCAGFPCQAFSIAGYRRGFEDTRGPCFSMLRKS